MVPRISKSRIGDRLFRLTIKLSFLIKHMVRAESGDPKSSLSYAALSGMNCNVKTPNSTGLKSRFRTWYKTAVFLTLCAASTPLLKLSTWILELGASPHF